MSLEETLSWPFFDDGHRRFAQALARWADATLTTLPHEDLDAACRARVKALGEGGFLKAVVAAEHGGLHRGLDVRTLCLARDILAFRDGLSDFAFAMQGLGTASISLFGSPALKARYLPPVRDGRAIATLKPSPGPPRRMASGTRTPSNRSFASGCGAITSMRSLTLRPGVSASTTNAESPLAPAASSVRAKTT